MIRPGYFRQRREAQRRDIARAGALVGVGLLLGALAAVVLLRGLGL